MQAFNAHRRGGRLRTQRPIAALGLMLALLLSGCRGHVDEMRMRIDESEQGSVTAQVSANVSENESDGDIMNSATFNDFNESGEVLTQRCNVRHVIYPRDQTLFLDLRSAFTDVDDLNSMLRCAAVNVREPSVEFERHGGFLWNTFIVRFAISQDRPRCPEDCAAPSFPQVILLTVPGKVHAINSLSRLVGINLAYRSDDDDTVRVTVDPAPDYRAQNLRHFANRRGPEEMDELKIEIISRVANFNLSTILSVIGMIFGSGLLIQASHLFFFRAKKKKVSG